MLGTIATCRRCKETVVCRVCPCVTVSLCHRVKHGRSPARRSKGTATNRLPISIHLYGPEQIRTLTRGHGGAETRWFVSSAPVSPCPCVTVLRMVVFLQTAFPFSIQACVPRMGCIRMSPARAKKGLADSGALELRLRRRPSFHAGEPGCCEWLLQNQRAQRRRC
jgi:hypothetical protein